MPDAFDALAAAPLVALAAGTVAPSFKLYLVVLALVAAFAGLALFGLLPDPGFDPRTEWNGGKRGPTPMELAVLASVPAVLSVAPAQAWRAATGASRPRYAVAVAISVVAAVALLFLWLV